jgi:formate hydrogenlyase subunit 6/NADH:ubiquinone oxidoreductase subunit I
VLLADSECVYCGLCEDRCPTGAIALVYEIVIGGD